MAPGPSTSTPTSARRSPTTRPCSRVVTSANVACGYHAGTPGDHARGLRGGGPARGRRSAPRSPTTTASTSGGSPATCRPTCCASRSPTRSARSTEIARGRGHAVRTSSRTGALPPGHRRRGAGGGGARRLRRPAGARHARARCSRWRGRAGRVTYYEGFPDRGYRDDGRLLPRVEPGALLEDVDAIAAAGRRARPPTCVAVRARGLARGGRPRPRGTPGPRGRRLDAAGAVKA